MKKAMLLLLTLALLVSGGALADEAYPETVDLTLYRAIFSASPIGTPIEEEWQARMEDYLGVKLNITWDELPSTRKCPCTWPLATGRTLSRFPL